MKWKEQVRRWQFWFAVSILFMLAVIFIILIRNKPYTSELVADVLSNKFTDQMCLKEGLKPVNSSLFMVYTPSGDFDSLTLECDNQKKVII